MTTWVGWVGEQTGLPQPGAWQIASALLREHQLLLSCESDMSAAISAEGQTTASAAWPILAKLRLSLSNESAVVFSVKFRKHLESVAEQHQIPIEVINRMMPGLLGYAAASLHRLGSSSTSSSSASASGESASKVDVVFVFKGDRCSFFADFSHAAKAADRAGVHRLLLENPALGALPSVVVRGSERTPFRLTDAAAYLCQQLVKLDKELAGKGRSARVVLVDFGVFEGALRTVLPLTTTAATGSSRPGKLAFVPWLGHRLTIAVASDWSQLQGASIKALHLQSLLPFDRLASVKDLLVAAEQLAASHGARLFPVGNADATMYLENKLEMHKLLAPHGWMLATTWVDMPKGRPTHKQAEEIALQLVGQRADGDFVVKGDQSSYSTCLQRIQVASPRDQTVVRLRDFILGKATEHHQGAVGLQPWVRGFEQREYRLFAVHNSTKRQFEVASAARTRNEQNDEVTAVQVLSSEPGYQLAFKLAEKILNLPAVVAHLRRLNQLAIRMDFGIQDGAAFLNEFAILPDAISFSGVHYCDVTSSVCAQSICGLLSRVLSDAAPLPSFLAASAPIPAPAQAPAPTPAPLPHFDQIAMSPEETRRQDVLVAALGLEKVETWMGGTCLHESFIVSTMNSARPFPLTLSEEHKLHPGYWYLQPDSAPPGNFSVTEVQRMEGQLDGNLDSSGRRAVAGCADANSNRLKGIGYRRYWLHVLITDTERFSLFARLLLCHLQTASPVADLQDYRASPGQPAFEGDDVKQILSKLRAPTGADWLYSVFVRDTRIGRQGDADQSNVFDVFCRLFAEMYRCELFVIPARSSKNQAWLDFSSLEQAKIDSRNVTIIAVTNHFRATRPRAFSDSQALGSCAPPLPGGSGPRAANEAKVYPAVHADLSLRLTRSGANGFSVANDGASIPAGTFILEFRGNLLASRIQISKAEFIHAQPSPLFQWPTECRLVELHAEIGSCDQYAIDATQAGAGQGGTLMPDHQSDLDLRGFSVNSSTGYGFGRLIRQSTGRPNLEMQVVDRRLLFFAASEIAPGVELTVDLSDQEAAASLVHPDVVPRGFLSSLQVRLQYKSLFRELPSCLDLRGQQRLPLADLRHMRASTGLRAMSLNPDGGRCLFRALSLITERSQADLQRLILALVRREYRCDSRPTMGNPATQTLAHQVTLLVHRILYNGPDKDLSAPPSLAGGGARTNEVVAQELATRLSQPSLGPDEWGGEAVARLVMLALDPPDRVDLVCINSSSNVDGRSTIHSLAWLWRCLPNEGAARGTAYLLRHNQAHFWLLTSYVDNLFVFMPAHEESFSRDVAIVLGMSRDATGTTSQTPMDVG